MKRWRVAFLLALLAALPILFAWNQSPLLLKDSDTHEIVRVIALPHNPLKWFAGDWPLQNAFYRPVSTMTFELDRILWDGNAAGYGFTNVALCFACVLLLFWLVREVTDRPWIAASSAALFAFWHNTIRIPISDFAQWAAFATLAVGIVRHRRDWRSYVPATLTLLCLSSELFGIVGLRNRMIEWIPGRTASTMTVFALIALASYARYERLRRAKAPTLEVTPETPPSTRNTVLARPKGVAWPWAVVSAFGVALALGSYEQAVMLPAVLVVLALAFKLGGAKPDWKLHAVFWALLLGYLALRWQLLPHVTSGYQKQQLRFSQTVFWSECDYLFPPLSSMIVIRSVIDSGFFLFLDARIYVWLMTWVITATGYLQTRKEPALALFGWAGSSLAFLPMAWVKLFEHYHYWPMALRSPFVVAIGAVGFRLAAIAWFPPSRPAPRRLDPAPGSLPRR